MITLLSALTDKNVAAVRGTQTAAMAFGRFSINFDTDIPFFKFAVLNLSDGNVCPGNGSQANWP
jgi:hypothetical protein